MAEVRMEWEELGEDLREEGRQAGGRRQEAGGRRQVLGVEDLESIENRAYPCEAHH